MSELSVILEMVKGRRTHEIARISAYLLAPGLVLILTIAGVHGAPFAIWLERPVAITELKTEFSERDGPTVKRGVALIVEPDESEYRIEVGAKAGAPSKVWSSLDEQTVRANRDRLVFSGGGLSGKGPFLGVNGPVAVVLEGELGNQIRVPGGTEPLDDWRLPSRRSLSLVSSVLLACVFAFGMSLAIGLPASRRDKRATG